MDADLDTLATALYVRIDDLLISRPERVPWRPRVGIAPRISDAELVTLCVMQALLSKMSGPGMFFRLPFVGGDLLKPITTDLSANDFLQLGWIKFRAGSTLHCRLGGRSLGDGFITGDQENIAVIQMVLGNSAPQPPPPRRLRLWPRLRARRGSLLACAQGAPRRHPHGRAAAARGGAA